VSPNGSKAQSLSAPAQCCPSGKPSDSITTFDGNHILCSLFNICLLAFVGSEPVADMSTIDDKNATSASPRTIASPGPVVNQLDDNARETFATGRPLEDSPELANCKHCKKSFLKSVIKSHVDACLAARKEVLRKKKELKEGKEKAKKKEESEKEKEKDKDKAKPKSKAIVDDDGDSKMDDEDEDAEADDSPEVPMKKPLAGLKSAKKKAETDGDKKGKKRKADGDAEKGPKQKKKKEEQKPKAPKPKGEPGLFDSNISDLRLINITT
jgi:SAGA-associated factor 73